MSLAETDLEKNPTAILLPDEKSHGLGARRENQAIKNLMAYFRRFWVTEVHHSGNTIAKKRYTSIVARVRGGVSRY